MESIQIYQESLAELKNVRKQLAFGQITINMDKLDGNTKEKLTYALSNVIADRTREITNNVLIGVEQ